MRPKEGTIKDYPSVEVWVEGFLNYIMILIVMLTFWISIAIPVLINPHLSQNARE